MVSSLKNRVHWTRFLPTFFVREQLNNCRNQALFTRIARNQNSLKRFLTNDIVWVCCYFLKKTSPHRLTRFLPKPNLTHSPTQTHEREEINQRRASIATIVLAFLHHACPPPPSTTAAPLPRSKSSLPL